MKINYSLQSKSLEFKRNGKEISSGYPPRRNSRNSRDHDQRVLKLGACHKEWYYTGTVAMLEFKLIGNEILFMKRLSFAKSSPSCLFLGTVNRGKNVCPLCRNRGEQNVCTLPRQLGKAFLRHPAVRSGSEAIAIQCKIREHHWIAFATQAHIPFLQVRVMLFAFLTVHKAMMTSFCLRHDSAKKWDRRNSRDHGCKQPQPSCKKYLWGVFKPFSFWKFLWTKNTYMQV